eukprot:4868552-Pyramimonas_sp.AAC.1
MTTYVFAHANDQLLLLVGDVFLSTVILRMIKIKIKNVRRHVVEVEASESPTAGACTVALLRHARVDC